MKDKTGANLLPGQLVISTEPTGRKLYGRALRPQEPYKGLGAGQVIYSLLTNPTEELWAEPSDLLAA